MLKRYEFQLVLSGHGGTPEEAWENCLEGFMQDPGIGDVVHEEIANECDTDPNDKADLRMAVACTNANGEPDIYYCRVRCNTYQYENGDHYLSAIESAKREDYEGPFVAMDEHDPPLAVINLFNWNTATTVDWHGEPIEKENPDV